MNYLHSQLFLQLGFKLDSGRDSASKLLCGDLTVELQTGLAVKRKAKGNAQVRRRAGSTCWAPLPQAQEEEVGQQAARKLTRDVPYTQLRVSRFFFTAARIDAIL